MLNATGDFLGDAVLLGNDQTPSAIWQNSSNFDIAVFEGNDADTLDYFAALSPSALAAWAVRGVTTVVQTVYSGNPVCATFNSGIPDPGILVFSPSL